MKLRITGSTFETSFRHDLCALFTQTVYTNMDPQIQPDTAPFESFIDLASSSDVGYLPDLSNVYERMEKVLRAPAVYGVSS